MTRGTRQWNAALARLDTEPGIAVIRTDRQGGKWHITVMRDPLAMSPSIIMASRGVDTNDVVGHWEPYVSTEPSLLLARARRVLAPPGGITLSLRGDTLVASGRAPAFWIVRAEGLAPALAGIDAVDLTRVAPGLPADMESIAAEVEQQHVLFSASADAVDQAAAGVVTRVAADIKTLFALAGRDHYDVSLQIVGRADPTGAESNNLALSRRRATTVRDRLVSLGVDAARLSVDAIGSNDPLPATSPAERARLNRSASFVIHAQPARSTSATERAR
jgi:OOP family OmpA-OmpF porin